VNEGDHGAKAIFNQKIGSFGAMGFHELAYHLTELAVLKGLVADICRNLDFQHKTHGIAPISCQLMIDRFDGRRRFCVKRATAGVYGPSVPTGSFRAAKAF
ncbi:MAG TPA: hypothetical protein V6D23_19775, partial [Candidatus Obscuribacterales bacterium]